MAGRMERKAPNLKTRDNDGTAKEATWICPGVLACAAMANVGLLRMTEDEAGSMVRRLLQRGLTLAVSRAGVRSTEGTRKRSLWASA